jgi:murein L,D-transpeptidase YafK
MSPGGDIMIHGLKNGQGSSGAFHRTVDWTDGCIALTDEEIEGMWSAVMVGTPVEIKP